MSTPDSPEPVKHIGAKGGIIEYYLFKISIAFINLKRNNPQCLPQFYKGIAHINSPIKKRLAVGI